MDASMAMQSATPPQRDKGPISSGINRLAANVTELEAALDAHYQRISPVLGMDEPTPGSGSDGDDNGSDLTRAINTLNARLINITINVNRMSQRVEL
jgi:hypothetical protein